MGHGELADSSHDLQEFTNTLDDVFWALYEDVSVAINCYLGIDEC